MSCVLILSFPSNASPSLESALSASQITMTSLAVADPCPHFPEDPTVVTSVRALFYKLTR